MKTGQLFNGQATLTNKVNGRCDGACFDLIELVYQKNAVNKK